MKRSAAVTVALLTLSALVFPGVAAGSTGQRTRLAVESMLASSPAALPSVGFPVDDNLWGISCPTTSECVIAGSNKSKDGAFVVGTANGGETWGAETTFANLNAMWGVSCSSPLICVATANSGGFARTIDGGADWTPVLSPAELSGISCASTSDCVAVGVHSGMNVAETTSNGGASWSEHTAAGPSGVVGVSCASTSDCVAVGYTITFSGVIKTTNNGGQTWTNNDAAESALTNSTLTQIWCPSVVRCVASGYVNNGGEAGGGLILTTSDGGLTWQNQTIPSGYTIIEDVTCSSTAHCVAVGDGGALTTSDGGETWTSHAIPTGTLGIRVSCASMSDCVAGGVYESTGGPLTFSTTNGGVDWSAQAGTSGVSCAKVSGNLSSLITLKNCTPKSRVAKSASAPGPWTLSGGTLTWAPNGQTTVVGLTAKNVGRGACPNRTTEFDISGSVTGGTSTYTAIGDEVSMRVCERKTLALSLVKGTTASL